MFVSQQMDFIIEAFVYSSPVFLFLNPIAEGHTAFFHNPPAGGVSFEETCRHLPEAHGSQLLNGSPKGIGGIAMSLIIRMDDVTHLNFVPRYTAVIHETNQPVIQIYAVFPMTGI